MGMQSEFASNDAGVAIRALAASGPDARRADQLLDFGQFVGSWDVQATFYDVQDRVKERRTAQWHFGWVLEGRAVQDVLIGSPADDRRGRGAAEPEYGSSMRMYDHERGLWHVSWFAPVRAVVVHLTGGRRGDDLVLEGVEQDGTNCTWVFSEITPNTFVWSGYESKLAVEDKPLVQQMFARRVGR